MIIKIISILPFFLQQIIPSDSFVIPSKTNTIHNLKSTSTTSKLSSTSDVAIVGCGVLGTSICKQLLSSNLKITAITKTTNNHESILKTIGDADNFELSTYENIKGKTFTNVIFCAPPSGFDGYPQAIQDTIDTVWNKEGAFIFTSSSAVYPYKNKEIVNESTPTAELKDGTPERLARLLKSENIVLQYENGHVLRLAGLYNRNRGAHNYYLMSKKDVLPGRGDYLVNLLHYDDAASACISTLNYHLNKPTIASEVRNKNVFIITDGNPKTRTEQCEICVNSKAGEYEGCEVPKFEGGDQSDYGKVLVNEYAKSVLGWVPKYESFDGFFGSIME